VCVFITAGPSHGHVFLFFPRQLSKSSKNDAVKRSRQKTMLPEPLIEKLETMIKSKSKRAKNVRTSWSLEDKRTVLAVFRVLNRK
jgi:hypothetical protein